MSATNKRRSVTEILQALQTALAAAAWLPALADPAAPALAWVDDPTADVSNGELYRVFVSLLTLNGETNLSAEAQLLAPEEDFALRVTWAAVTDPRVVSVRVWCYDNGSNLKLVATVAPDAGYYDIVETLSVLSGRPAATPPAANTVIAEPAFQNVKLFDIANLATALQELTAAGQRLCFIIPDLERFESVLQGATKMLVRRTLPVALLISDSVLGDRQKALHGAMASGSVPPVCGAFPLQEIALAAVTGQLLSPGSGKGGVLCSPTGATVLTVEDVKKKLPGRACVELDLDCAGGTLEAATGPGPTL